MEIRTAPKTPKPNVTPKTQPSSSSNRSKKKQKEDKEFCDLLVKAVEEKYPELLKKPLPKNEKVAKEIFEILGRKPQPEPPERNVKEKRPLKQIQDETLLFHNDYKDILPFISDKEKELIYETLTEKPFRSKADENLRLFATSTSFVIGISLILFSVLLTILSLLP